MTEYSKLTIKQWAEEDRPREKMLKKGFGSLSDAELLAILIGSGNREESAVELCKRILNDVKNNLNELAKLSIDELMKCYKGIGEAKAISIVAALELGRRRKLSEIINKKQVTCSKDVYEYFSAIIGDLYHEEFWILLLNRANKIIDKQNISKGGLAATVVDVRLVMKLALEKTASAIILCHNHPSGNLQPSNEDILITKKLQESGEILDIPVLDHIIISDNSFYSFADEGIL